MTAPQRKRSGGNRGGRISWQARTGCTRRLNEASLPQPRRARSIWLAIPPPALPQRKRRGRNHGGARSSISRCSCTPDLNESAAGRNRGACPVLRDTKNNLPLASTKASRPKPRRVTGRRSRHADWRCLDESAAAATTARAWARVSASRLNESAAAVTAAGDWAMMVSATSVLPQRSAAAVAAAADAQHDVPRVGGVASTKAPQP
jgi:hypothetical protein